MKQINSAFLILVACFSFLVSGPVFAQNWKEQKGDHFIVYYVGDDKFAEQVLSKSEEYYNKISSDLGYQRYSNFWQWENRVKIYIHPTREEFLKTTGRNEWSHGYANYTSKEIISYVWEVGFIESLLPHEITHLLFRDYVGFQGQVPVWLDEGVAQWEEPDKRAIVKQVMASYLSDGQSYKFDDFMQLDIRNVTIDKAVELFYVQAASIVDFLVREYGTDSFVYFCRQLRDGKTLNEALEFSYPTHIRNITEMEEKWIKYINSKV